MALHAYQSSSRELRPEDVHFKARLGYILRPHFKDRGSCSCLVFGGGRCELALTIKICALTSHQLKHRSGRGLR